MTKQKVLGISLLILIILTVIAIYYTSRPKVLGDVPLEGVNSKTLLNDINQQDLALNKFQGETARNGEIAENQNSETANQPNNPTQEPAVQAVATNLEIPWEIVFLPDQSLLVTQRPGSIVHILPGSKKTIEVSGVNHYGEGGLLGMTIHPDYRNNHWVYIYLTSKSGSTVLNRVERYTYNESNKTLNNKQVILDKIPGAVYHDGGRISFGPDGMLYVTTGDAGSSGSAQSINTLSGKILRMTDSGGVPNDNPYSNLVYSYGHRNPQGLAWDANGNLWATEHGPSGVNTGYDEVNFIMKGANYGWPTITGNQTKSGMVAPVIQSGSTDTWAPAGMVIVGDKLFFTGLRGESLYSARITDNKLINFTKNFTGEFGRLRALVLDPSKKWLYVSTSNRDGRGKVNENDDKIIKIKLELFQ